MSNEMKMSNEIMPFMYGDKPVRAMKDASGTEWFCLKDVCDALEITRAHPESLDPDGCLTVALTDSMGRAQDTYFIDEGNLYEVTLTSRKEEAVKFKRWVTREVVPAIRKTGSYSPKPVSTIDALEITVRAMREIETRQNIAEAHQKAIESKVDCITAKMASYSESHFALRGWYHMQGKNLDGKEASKIGKRLIKYCKENNIEVQNIPDPKWGSVHAYPREVLEKLPAIMESMS